jgi:putative hydrolase of the HAD superfamily
VSRWRAIVFDLDDTLYPERDYVVSGMGAAASWAEKQLGIPAEQGFAQLMSLFEQGVRGNSFNLWLEAHGLCDEGLVAATVNVYRSHQPTLRLFPEVQTLLASLRRRYRLGLVSDGYADVQRRKLAALDVAQHFDAIVLSDELGRHAWKPSPEPLLTVLERLGRIEAENSVYVADNPKKDFLAARRAGLASIRVRRPGGEYSRMEPIAPEHEPDLTVTSLENLELRLRALSAVAMARTRGSSVGTRPRSSR